jgi:biotin carboxylase
LRTPLFVLIESNTTGTGRLFGRAARALGYVPVVVTADPGRYPYLGQEAFRVERAETGRLEAVIRRVSSLAEEAPVAGVYTSSEYFTVTAAEVARSLRRPGPEPEALAVARDKGLQYEALRRAGVPVPPFETVTARRDAASAVRRIGLPCVIKPLSGTGSVDVRRWDEVRGAEAHLDELLRARTNERGMAVTPGAVVMGYVAGAEYSVEVFSGAAVGITRKHLSAEPSFVETGHDFPAHLSLEAHREMAGCALRAVEALGLGWGPVHVELRLGAEGPAIMEVNGRLAGGFIPELVREARGVDLIEATVRVACGDDVDLAPRRLWAASIRFVVVEARGRFGGIDGVSTVITGDGLADVRVYKDAGSLVEPHGDFRDRVGHVLAVGRDVEESAQRAEAARSRLRPMVEPAPPASTVA